jgi:hypothetical protein
MAVVLNDVRFRGKADIDWMRKQTLRWRKVTQK